jgi:hypothetical protein
MPDGVWSVGGDDDDEGVHAPTALTALAAHSHDSGESAECRQRHGASKKDKSELRRHKSDVGVHGGFGLKRITFLGSCCLNLNNCMGPAMVLLPVLNQQVCNAFHLSPHLVLFDRVTHLTSHIFLVFGEGPDGFVKSLHTHTILFTSFLGASACVRV